MNEDLKMASGVAKELSEDDKIRDDVGFTNPNLHRRVDPQTPSDPRETAPRSYTIGVYDGIHSFRTTEVFYHDEESTTCEIP